MDILYELRDGEKLSLQHFDSRELYPGYKHEEGKSNLYIFAPMNYLNYIIGYVAIKNAPGLLYNIDLSKFINNMNAQLFSMRRHIFSQRANNELKRIYMKDALTGMYNRTGCENVLYEYISELKEKGEKAILVFADIDRMKTINDQYGHLNGDIVLKRLGQIISKETTNEIKAYRYGGEEFIILVEKPVLPYIKAISQRIRRHMEEQEWEYYLHKVFDKSFNDFKNNVDTEARNSLARREFNVETTIQESIDIANMDFEIIPEN